METLSVNKESFQEIVVALDQFLAPPSVDMSDTVEMRVISLIEFSDNALLGLSPVVNGIRRLLEHDALDCLVKEGVGELRTAQHRQANINHFNIHVSRALDEAPLTTDPEIGLFHVPINVRWAAVFLGALGLAAAVGSITHFRCHTPFESSRQLYRL